MVPKPSHLAKGDIQQHLIDKGLMLFLEYGYAATSVKHIVDAAEVPKGSFYYYFKSKEDFCLAVLEHYAAQKKEKFEKLAENTLLSPLNKLRTHLAESILELQKEDFQHGCLIGSLAQEITTQSKTLREALDGIFQRWLEVHLRIFEAAQAAGELPPNSNLKALVDCYALMLQGALIEAKITKSIRGFKMLHWLYFVELGNPQNALSEEIEHLFAL